MQLIHIDLKKIPFTKENIKKTKKEVGVYVFWDENKNPLYVGKSTSLQNRLDSYLSNDLHVKTQAMVLQARYISTIPVTSELESLLLEARLVKENQPKYNIELKDDKTPLYIKITNDEYPRVVTARKADVSESDTAIYFGPFPSSSNVKMIMKLLRRVFHYSQHLPTKRTCIYAQMGLCRPCPSDIENEQDTIKKMEMRRLYKRNITYIKMVLTGRMKSLKKELITKMNTLSNDERFEEAQSIKKLLEQLNYVTQPVNATSLYLENPNLVGDIRTKELQQLTHILSPFFDSLSKIHRIECYDIAHIAGSYPTASMVTFINGEADKTYYRHFKITPTKGGDDYASLSEVATRRKKHFDDWGKPDLIIVDGGKGQLKAFLSVFAGFDIPIVGLAKREETLVIQNKTQIPKAFSEIRVPDGPVLHLVQRIRNEAHRFARRLHHKLVSKALTGL